MTTYINLTPHPLSIFDEQGALVLSLSPAAGMRTPRVSQINERVAEAEAETPNGVVPVYRPQFGEVTDLPPRRNGYIYIVSRMVRSAVQGRSDIVCPGLPIRDELGRITGAKGLSY